MDYEKKYKEALKDMRAIYPNLKGDAKLAVEHAFPELAESEDERHRKWILEYLYDGLRKADEQFKGQFNAAIAYLEKQEEQKPAEGDKTNGWTGVDLERYLSCLQRLGTGNPQQPETINSKWFKEHCHPQPKQEWSENDEKMVRFYEADYNNQIGDMPMIDVINMRLEFKSWLTNRLKFIRPQPQMLEDWTSEDDELLADVLGCITLVQTYKACGDLKEFKMKYTGEELRSFVRSLKSRPRKQPSWKPSEQEKGALRTAIYILTNERNFPKAAAQLQNILDAFEGKESRKDWKPSEEQMEALKWLVEYVSPSEKYIVIVKNLYEQLKKFT